MYEAGRVRQGAGGATRNLWEKRVNSELRVCDDGEFKDIEGSVITPEQLKPFLQHDDGHIRGAVISYFGHSLLEDRDVLETILREVGRRGEIRELSAITYSKRVAFSSTSLSLAFDLLEKAEKNDDILVLNQLLIEAPGVLLREEGGVLEGRANLLMETKARLERRAEMSGWSGEKLYERLQAISSRSRDEDDEGEIDWEENEDLLESLSRHDVPSDAEMGRLLQGKEGHLGALELALLKLAGLRGLRSLIPYLVAILASDDDCECEEAATSLVMLGDPEAARLIELGFPSAAEGARMTSASVLSRLKLERSEEAILELLKSEENRTIRTMLCCGLCELFSERGIEVVKKEILAGYDKTYTSLEQELLPVAEVLGVELLEAEEWKRNRVEAERAFAAKLAEWKIEKVSKPISRTERFEPRGEFHEAPHSPVETIRNVGPRVGRNDPCPCGSGKKFKKCCA